MKLFSTIELRDLGKSLGALGVAFTIAQIGILTLFSSPLSFVIVFIISILTIGIGFLLHELMHKFVARHFGCWAEYRSDDRMLIMSMLFALAGFLFAAPGAVIIRGHITIQKNGIISAAGPLTNGLLAVLFFLLGFFLNSGDTLLGLLFSMGAMINIWLAAFNMIPLGNFDGAKIFRWNIPVYVGMVVFFGVLFIV